MTGTEARAKGIKYEKGVFRWAAFGRSLSNGRSEGVAKLLFDPEDDRKHPLEAAVFSPFWASSATFALNSGACGLQF